MGTAKQKAVAVDLECLKGWRAMISNRRFRKQNKKIPANQTVANFENLQVSLGCCESGATG